MRSSLARRITAADLQWEMGAAIDLETWEPHDGSKTEYVGDIRLVQSGNRIEGWCFYDDVTMAKLMESALSDPSDEVQKAFGLSKDSQSADSLKSYLHPIEPTRFVAANAPVIELPKHMALHEKEPFLFVVDGTEISGVVDFGDLFHPNGLFVFAALALDLETAAVDLLCRLPDAWESLKPERKDKAKERFHDLFAPLRQTQLDEMDLNESILEDLNVRLRRDLMQCTMFSDKKEMIKRAKLIPFTSNENIERAFKDAEKLRNAALHPHSQSAWEDGLLLDEGPRPGVSLVGQLLKFTPSKLAEAIDRIISLTDTIREYTIMPDTEGSASVSSVKDTTGPDVSKSKSVQVD